MGAAQLIDIHGAKGGSDKPKTPTEAPDSLRSIALAKMLIAVGEGEFDGTPTAKNIFLDNTPLQDEQGNLNFPNVKWEWRTGSVEQPYIPGIPSVENETTLGIELRSGTPWVRAISNTQLSAVRLRFAWPMLQSIDASGNINGYRIEFKIEVATDGGAYKEVLNEAVDGKTTSVYERTRRIDLPKAVSGWLLRITRLTANQNNNKIADTMQIAGFTEVIDAKLRYPNTALLYIEFSAEQFRNIPAVTIECDARKMSVPSNYDPRTRSYSGIWDGTFKQAWTDNPVWMTYDVTVNDRFGLGRRIKPWQVDKWELYRIAQYCDQLVPDGKGGMEPRFICNLNLQGKADAWTLLRDISAIYRGMTYWAQGQVFSLSDMPRATDFDFAYTRANVIDGKFTYASASERTRYSRALISYDNPANNYDTDVTAVTDSKLQRRYGDNPLEISAIGCTRESEAQRRGKWALLTNAKDRAVTFRTGLAGRIPLPGYVIPIADELIAGRPVGGLVSAVAGKVITLDRDTSAKPGDRLILNLPDGKCEGRTIQLVSGRKLTVTTAYSVAPESELVWCLDADDLAVPLYRVTSVSRPEPGVFEISAVQYDPSKFAHIDTGARLEERPISVIPITVVPAPASVALTSSSSVAQGLAVTTMTIAWASVPGAVAYDVEWRKDNGNWIKVQRTGSSSVEVPGIYAGAYLARVRAVSAFEISSIWRNSQLTQLKGKEGLPPAITHLTTESLVYGIRLNWGFPPGAEDTQRTEIWQNKANDLQSAIKLGDYAYPQARHELQNIVPGTSLFFWARLVDRTGNVGPWFPEKFGVNGQPSSDQTEYEKYFAGKIGTGALYPELKKDIELITGDGPGSVKELAEQVKELGDKVEGLVDTFIYDPKLTYKTGENAREGRHIYQALQAVPLDTPPPNPAYWKDIGEILETANGLAFQVNQNTTSIKDLDGKVTASASSLEALRAAARGDTGEGELADALKSWQSTAELAVEKRVRATEDEAISERVTTFGAQVGENKAGLSSLEKVVATNDSVAAKRITELKGELVDVNSGVAGNTQALETLSGEVSRIDGAVVATASSLESLRAEARSDTGEGDLAGALDAWSSTANFALEKKVRATAEEALAMKTEQLQVNLNQTTASVEQVSKAVVDVNGRVSAQTTVKAETIVGGRKVMAGLALGSDGDTSEILAFAQRFAIIDEVTGQLRTPFVVQGGQVFINYAMIDTAFIQNLVLGMTLRSSALNAKGLPLLEINIPQGMLTLRSPGAGGSTTLNNNGLLVQDEDDSVRLRAGNLTLLKAGG
ncbi:phage tail protein [Pseudomonas lundensis]|uniref:Phage host specificity protein n=2 Tax=Pseudomonas lundensis TaxID=86185 RepID=A0AAX2H819_9PSED|nr:phage tail protein [Pseudomonas lundensis]SOB52732.1 putative phage host specificity protein [Pseudomonas lundensis]